MNDLPIYSPSETDDYLVCPRFRVLKREWCPRGSLWTPHLALGNAIHAGLARRYFTMPPGGSDEAVYTDAYAVMDAEYREGSEWSLEGCRKLVDKGLKVALATELVSPDGTVVLVEDWAGHSKIDLVTRESFGLVVTDHKVSLELEKRRLDYKIREHDPSWQLLHEAWAVREHFGECPKWARAHFIAVGPRPFTYIHSIQVDDKRLDDWYQSAETHWARMARDTAAYQASDLGRPLPPMNPRSCWRYGRKCEFHDLCNVYGGDLTKAPVLYHPISEAE